MEISSTTDSALQILLHIRDRGALRTDQLVELTGNSRTSVARLLATLESRGFVVRSDKTFVLGSMMATFGHAVAPALRFAARQPLAELSAQCGETVVLALREGQHFVVVDQLAARNWITTVQYTSAPSQLLSVAAHGRAILAHLDPAEYGAIRNAHPDPLWLDAECQKIRATHVSTSSGELEDNVVGIATVIMDAAGQPVASVGLIAPASRADLTAWNEMVPAAAGSITGALVRQGSS